MTYRTIGLEIDDHIYQQAVSKAVTEGKTINQVLVEFLNFYISQSNQPTSPSVRSIVSSPPSAKTIPKTSSPQTTYIVKSGDTLGAIARKIYGSANKYYLIQKANNISDPRRIWVGQELVIPPLKEETTTVTTTSVVTATPQPVVTTTTPSIVPVSISVPRPSSGKNPAPTFRFVGSPNFNKRPQSEISAIVMHSTANGSLKGVINWFNRSDAQVSAHYTIGKDGSIVQHVRDEHRAWHAGKSTWQGRNDLNSWSIGIELVNWNNGEDPYPETQHQASIDLCAYLCSKYNINPNNIVAHYDVSPRRKTDPKGYNMDRLRQEVSSRL